jgi:hypothetical protein
MAAFRGALSLVVLLVAAPPAALLALPDGAVDTAFGGGDGIATWEAFGAVTLADLAASEELLIGVGSYFLASGPPQLHWWSVDSAGNHDLDHFCEGESDEIFPISLSTSSRAVTAIVDSLGRLVVGGAMSIVGTETQDRALLARFDLSQEGCVLDAAFSSNGWELFDDKSWCDTEDCDVMDVVELSPATGAVLTPKLVALVRASAGGAGLWRLFLLRLTPAGSPDTTFSGDGWVEILHSGVGTFWDETALAVDAMGRLYVAVTHSDEDSPFDLDVSLLRYQPNGTLDSGFGTGGMVPVSDGGAGDPIDARAHRLTLGPDGSIFLSLSEPGATLPSRIYTRRASDGFVSGLGGNVAPSELAFQGNGRLLFARDRDENVPDNFRGQRYRYEPGNWAAADTTFGAGTSFADYDVDLGGGDAEQVRAAILWHGRPVFGGTASAIGTTASFLLRVQNDYIFADGFEGRTVALWSAATGVATPE